MDAKTLQDLAQKIKIQEEELQANKMVFNLYQKSEFLKNHFDEDALINMYVSWSKERVSMSIMSGRFKEEHTVIDSDYIKAKGVELFFPDECLMDQRTKNLVFKNNPQGHQEFFKEALGANYIYFTALSLESQLSEKQNDTFKSPKI